MCSGLLGGVTTPLDVLRLTGVCGKLLAAEAVSAREPILDTADDGSVVVVEYAVIGEQGGAAGCRTGLSVNVDDDKFAGIVRDDGLTFLGTGSSGGAPTDLRLVAVPGPSGSVTCAIVSMLWAINIICSVSPWWRDCDVWFAELARSWPAAGGSR